MANLFERLIGQDLELGEKIAIHAFTGAVNEWRRNKLTGVEVSAMFELDAGQQVEGAALKDLLVAAPDKLEFMRVLKDWLYMGEVQADPRYLVRANLLARLEQEVIDQGGTLP